MLGAVVVFGGGIEMLVNGAIHNAAGKKERRRTRRRQTLAGIVTPGYRERKSTPRFKRTERKG